MYAEVKDPIANPPSSTLTSPGTRLVQTVFAKQSYTRVIGTSIGQSQCARPQRFISMVFGGPAGRRPPISFFSTQIVVWMFGPRFFPPIFFFVFTLLQALRCRVYR